QGTKPGGPGTSHPAGRMCEAPYAPIPLRRARLPLLRGAGRVHRRGTPRAHPPDVRTGAPNHQQPPFERNGRFRWFAVAPGTVFGRVVGRWSFQGPLAAPAGLEDYAGLPRRLLRLSHIACIALGALNVILSVDRQVGGGRAARAGGSLLLWGSIGLPP